MECIECDVTEAGKKRIEIGAITMCHEGGSAGQLSHTKHYAVGNAAFTTRLIVLLPKGWQVGMTRLTPCAGVYATDVELKPPCVPAAGRTTDRGIATETSDLVNVTG